jgi:hypothetical protein
MKKIIISEEEKSRILLMHESATKRHYLGESSTIEEQTGPIGPDGFPTANIKKEQPDSVTINQTLYDGTTRKITFYKNGTVTSDKPFCPGSNIKSGKFTYSSKTGSQFGGGYINYPGGCSQEINSDIPANGDLSTLISQNKQDYLALPLMTKLANLEDANYSVPGQDGQGQSAQVAGAKTPGCPAGCIKDPNYKGTPQKWAPVKG